MKYVMRQPGPHLNLIIRNFFWYDASALICLLLFQSCADVGQIFVPLQKLFHILKKKFIRNGR